METISIPPVSIKSAVKKKKTSTIPHIKKSKKFSLYEYLKNVKHYNIALGLFNK